MKHPYVKKIQEIMNFYSYDCWIMYTDEHSDPCFSKYISDKLISTSICVITPYHAYIIANSLDFDNLHPYDDVENVCYSSKTGIDLDGVLERVIKEINYPKIISLSFTTMQDALVDVLGHGMYITLNEKLEKIFDSVDRKPSYASAEKIIYALAERREPLELERMKLAAKRADEILAEAFKQIRVGMTELEVVSIVHKIFEHKPNYFDDAQVISEDFSWNKDFCPVFICGPNFVKGGHAMPSQTQVAKGYTLYFDFGVKLTFSDNTYFSSDLQRMGYILAEGEVQPPPNVTNIFNALYEAISLGINLMKPGMPGFEIDEVVRGHIIGQGFEDYDHATGHSIGQVAHNPGALLGPKSRGLSNLEIQPNAVYTIEPRIPVHNGGSIEEMILVTESGAVSISPRQEKLIVLSL